MKRQHYRPFNPGQAQAGAPYGYINNDTEVKIYEYFVDYCIGAYSIDGKPWVGVNWDYNYDYLVMLPIATCQGKPVFVGDALHDENGDKFEVETYHNPDMLGRCTWEPARARVETRMTELELDQAWDKIGDSLVPIANAAIQRAIEDGDVVAKDEIVKILEAASSLYVQYFNGKHGPITFNDIMQKYKESK